MGGRGGGGGEGVDWAKYKTFVEGENFADYR